VLFIFCSLTNKGHDAFEDFSSFHDLKSSRLVSRYRFTFIAYSGSTKLAPRLIVIPTSIPEVVCREWDFQIGTDLLSELLPACHFCQSSHPPKPVQHTQLDSVVA
jgi:hypothetical protein